MNTNQLLAAELFNYSYDNYADHVAVDNLRFTEYMPEDVEKLQKAERGNWSHERIAQELEIEESKVDEWLESFKRAKDIVFAENASESFRESVKYSIKDALQEGGKTEEEIDDLVIQICYRAADLGYLLELEGKRLSDYSKWLRRKKDVDYGGIIVST